mmetsp:Transcript_32777/g.92995  ORF Transcript_32777/g.92995 Transcript_32777/m.92995 type:complete len:212 (-) Transcript_32777:152-787(-)|eukprot:CAMPEP_0117668954 /NCGR_PEP_ID=MMETSP0804-20121206/11848_1 /TAXON_ID=1074897 /ORGANISM="Tetraselmis astigmatica, Strain CCMP880" /LENGTH=211 /DNA_ID=CAMNT_0005476927 /DNA_START=118 /DNA_END=753 /DNA_ORIENTATION=-
MAFSTAITTSNMSTIATKCQYADAVERLSPALTSRPVFRPRLPTRRSVSVRASQETEMDLEQKVGLEDDSQVPPPAPPASQASVEEQLIEVTSPPNGGAKPMNAGEAMAFTGPAPELINGRLAMIGVVSAIGAELASGQSVVSQFDQATGPILFAFMAITAASLAPLRSIGKKRRGFGPFTPAAEMINGRAAMLGFAALIGTELATHHALF